MTRLGFVLLVLGAAFALVGLLGVAVDRPWGAAVGAVGSSVAMLGVVVTAMAAKPES